MFYSPARRGFFDPSIHSTMPPDVVEITANEYADLMAAQTAGKMIVPDGDGQPPVAIDTEQQQAVPVSVTPRQGLIILSRAGLLAGVQAALAAMEGQAGEESRIDFERAGEWRRDWPLLNALASGLGLTDEQIDQMFVDASMV